jgi:hypothetical protein
LLRQISEQPWESRTAFLDGSSCRKKVQSDIADMAAKYPGSVFDDHGVTGEKIRKATWRSSNYPDENIASRPRKHAKSSHTMLSQAPAYCRPLLKEPGSLNPQRLGVYRSVPLSCRSGFNPMPLSRTSTGSLVLGLLS